MPESACAGRESALLALCTRPIKLTGRKTPLSQARSVLLIHPPFSCPAGPPLSPALAAARLRAAGASVSVYDANRDLFLNHLLRPDFLRNCLNLVREKQSRGGYESLNDRLLSKRLAEVKADPAQGEKLFTLAANAVAALKSDRFYIPSELVAARERLEAALELASLAYFPYRLHWNGLHHPDAQTWDAAQAIAQGDGNPFHVLASYLLNLVQGRETVAFCVQCPDQLLPALTLRAIVMEQYPDIRICFWGPGLHDAAGPEDLAWLPGQDPAVLCTALDLSDPGPQPPDFAGMEGYLAPESIEGAVKEYDAGATPSLDMLKDDHAAGVMVARWLASGNAEPQVLAAALRASSKAGMWNQIELAPGAAQDDLAAWCAANPNLAHSVVIEQAGAPGFCGPPPEEPAPEPKVGTLQPMPGRPIWRWLEQEAHLALYVRNHGVRSARTCRIRDDGTVYNLGLGVEYHFVHYPDLNEWHLQSILDLITSAGKVKPDWLRHNIERSFLVAYALEEGVMIATETLKHPRPEYIQKVRERTGLDFTKYLERGYIVVRPEYRGLGVGDYVVKGCLARAEGYKTFLTISAENETAKEMTFRHGTRFFLRYYSEEMGKEIELWTPGDQDNLPEGREAKCK